MPSREHSRRGSNDGLEILEGETDEDRQVSANTLANRLASLQFHPASSSSGYTTPPRPAIARGTSEAEQHSDTSRRGSDSHNATREQSRRGSSSSHAATSTTEPQHIEYNTEALSRVPSYRTALSVPTRSLGITPGGLPDYETATSRPPSPLQHPTAGDSTGSVSPPDEPPVISATPPERHARFASEPEELSSSSERRRGTRGLALRSMLRQGTS